MRLNCKLAAAAVTGTSHQARGQPCQDYAAVRSAPPIAAIALADGAGTAAHADIGAMLTVTGMLELLHNEFAELSATTGKGCAERIVHTLQQALADYAQCNNLNCHDLAATLLFVATDGTHYLGGQLGDGRIARCQTDGSTVTSLFTPVKGEYFNQTVFITDRCAIDDLQLAQGELTGIGGFVLMSDGAEESLYQRQTATFAPAVLKMLCWLEQHSETAVCQALTRNLTDTLSCRTGDDLSIALLRLLPTLRG